MKHTFRVIHQSRMAILFIVPLFCGLCSPLSAAAACSPQDPSWGQASTSFTIPTTGSYRVWSRLSAPDLTNNSYTLEIDGTTCGIVVGDGSAIPANSWTWVDYKSGNTSSPIDVTLAAGTHNLVVIGRENSVELDRIIFTADTSCVPIGTGDNCAVVIPTPPGSGGNGSGSGGTPGGTVTTDKPTVVAAGTNGSITVQASSSPLSVASGTGLVIAPAIDPASGSVKSVQYFIDNKLVDTETKPPYTYKINTSNLKNGSHTLVSKVFYTNGTTKSTTQQLNIKNTAAKKSVNGIGISLILVAGIIGGLILLQRRRGGFMWHGLTLIPTDHPVSEDVALAIHSSDQPVDKAPLSNQMPIPGSVITYQPDPDEPKVPR